jgi:hypothetical protein
MSDQTIVPTETEQNLSSPLARRHFLGLLGAAGASLLLPATSAQAFFAPLQQRSAADVCRSLGIPTTWVEQMGAALTDYASYLSKSPLGHISVKQIIEPHLKRHGRVGNSIPPKALWKNIRSTLTVADRLADRLSEPLEEVISAYRSPAYNATCPGGKSNSMHLRNNALDLRFPIAPRKVAAVAKELRANGLFKGGIGLYSGFTHIDTRGYNADW